ncbi:MAG: inorganic diphosphatase [Saprospiraceae bacterium]|nr:inorganic diphosphatase [Saprospiraceae bacterium]
MLHKWTTLSLLFACLLLSCQNQSNKQNYALPAIEEDVINVIVEIPAGTNTKIEYNTASGTFQPDQVDGEDRVVAFLPYPGNYGFIPSTLMDEERGGDGDALDILVIGSSQPTGSVVKAKAVGTLLLKDNGELDTKIIAVPADAEERTLAAENFLELMLDHDPAKRIIEEWFLNYKGKGQMELIRWEDENYALQEIDKWKVK